MSSQFKGSMHDPDDPASRPTSELWGPWGPFDEPTQPQPADNAPGGIQQQGSAPYESPAYREHVSGTLPSYPSEAPHFQPTYNPYPPHPAAGYPMPVAPAYPGYPPYPPYAPYPGYQPYAWQPPRPKRDGYLFAMAIISTVGAGLILLGGMASVLILLIFVALPHTTLSESQAFSGELALVDFALVGLIGGGLCLYHSIRSLMRKPSAPFVLPRFWLFALLYGATLGGGFALRASGQEVKYPILTGGLILLAGIFPAFTFLALAVWRLRYRVAKPGKSIWATSWRRFTVALTSGASSGLGLALLLELAVLALLVPGQQGIAVQQCLNSNAPNPQSCLQPSVINAIVLTFAVFGPLIEEIVKPLAVVVIIGRIRNEAEAFLLGMACGVGFDLVETTLYIGSGYNDWLNVALLRSAAGLLHGFGAAVVALGWYYLIRGKNYSLGQRLLRTLGCWVYAALQHGLWNATVFVGLLPAPLGPFLDSWSLNLGFTTLSSVVVIYIVEMVLMTAFFLFVLRRLKKRVGPPATSRQDNQIGQPVPQIAPLPGA